MSNSLLYTSVLLLFFSCGEKNQLFQVETTFIEYESGKTETMVAGSGENTVVFESGLGVDGKTWIESGIFDSIGRDNQVLAYNRAGYGKSTQNGERRGLQELVKELHNVITAKSENEKVLLVGHSLGGAVVRAYAVQYPEKVKAVLFIEPNHEKFRQYADMTQKHEDDLVQQFNGEKQKGAALESAELIENVSFLKKLKPLPNIPVIVITSVKTDSEMTPELVTDWLKAHQTLSKGIVKFTHVKTNKSGHFVYLDEPDLVIKTIRKLLK